MKSILRIKRVYEGIWDVFHGPGNSSRGKKIGQIVTDRYDGQRSFESCEEFVRMTSRELWHLKRMIDDAPFLLEDTA